MEPINLVWNRACFRDWREPRGGDRALGALLQLHGLTMNGGIDHAVECLKSEEIEAAAEGYRYFGYHRISDMVRDAPTGFNGLEEEAHEKYRVSLEVLYYSDIPSDSGLFARFQAHYSANPSEYAPLSQEAEPTRAANGASRRG